ncbi:MAG: tyrosine-type recombinase/integrase [Bacteroidetes bacterium]|nr:tyrosine-type recombinase/integrase [Bacteroidota bacterium]
MALHFGCLPTELDEEQIKDYLYELQQRSKTPSETYFKHTVYGLRFMLKGEGLPYSHLHLPSIKRDKKLPTVLSQKEVWEMLKAATLLKHKMLIGLLYGCGLRCMEIRNIRLADMDFERRQLHIRQSRGRKDRMVPLSEHLIRGLKKYIAAEHPTGWLFTGSGNPQGQGFDGRYSQRGVQWAVKRIAKEAGITKEVCVHTLRHTYACHLLEAGMNIVTLKELMGHANIETTMEYLHICQLDDRRMFSPLDTLFDRCAPAVK